MNLTSPLQELADQNISGAAFLLAYGMTWLVCAVLWERATSRTAAVATLFQGVIAFPAAIGLSFLIGAFNQPSPVPAEITQLSILIGTSQLLGLPFLIYLAVTERYSLLPVAFASMVSMHFVLYSWLYQTPWYIVMAVLISVAAVIMMATAPKAPERVGPARVCWVTGILLLLTAAAFLILHLLSM
ncbi:hypothetical protein I2485_15255 [Nesterenkonia sp. E16_7]|uniref:DUF7010 family protein n=1 Tax=unclassified Nesterenkonia TaxID=2629769 RepID=UPI001A90E7B1|nr:MULTISPECIES: hypothetical protein [unclassified Nesterenkonia]MBO0596811.1 hypothetical protein [Nesterenkonia sp. E16_10]MBO0600006.1 hypothetical protein [Nesterenkonia sp. E16_7]